MAQELLNLELTSPDLKAALCDLYITGVKEVEIADGRKAIIVYIPFKLRTAFHKVHARLVRELEKNFLGKHVLLLAQWNLLGKSFARSTKGTKGPRPRSRTLTAVQDAIMEDICNPTEIVGKRTPVKLDGKRMTKIYLDSKDQANVEGRLDTYAAEFGKLTHKTVNFLFQ